MTTPQRVTIRVPSVGRKADGETDDQRYREIANRIREFNTVGGSHSRDAVADLLDHIADRLNPDLTEPVMADGDRALYTAARDRQGNARLQSGRGRLVATPDHTIADVQRWLDNAEREVPSRIEREEKYPWHWVRQYRSVKELFEHEQGA